MNGHRIDPDAAWSDRARLLARRCGTIIGVASVLVPREDRAGWVAEWNAEVWHHLDALERSTGIDSRTARALTARALGAFQHAWWMRSQPWRVEMLWHDLKYAARVNRKHPAFSLVVIVTLGLGIGATTAMFSIVNSVLLKPLPYPQSERLVYAYGAFSKSDQAAISPPDFLDYRNANHVFSSFAARSFFGRVVLTGAGDPEQVTAPFVSANFFATLGVRPMFGRDFLPTEEIGIHNVVLLSYGLWQRRYGGRRDIVGSTIEVDGEPRTVVGVMPPILDRTMQDQLWRPFAFRIDDSSVRRFHMLRGVGRLEPDVTLAQAQAELDAIAGRLASTYPENKTWHLHLEPYQNVVVGAVAPALRLLLAAVGVVLLIACGNVASLMLARAVTRETEVALRTAIGAARGRIVRQLLTESVMLSVLAGTAGLLLALLLVRVVRVTAGTFMPRAAELGVDGRVLVFTALVSLVTGLVFGVAPALHAVRRDVAAALRTLGRTSAGRVTLRLRDGLVVAQVALSFVLLIGAGLLLRSLWLVERVDPGFDARNVFTAQLTLPTGKYGTRLETTPFWTTALERIRALPGVRSAALTGMLPLVGGGDTYYFVDGQPPATPAARRTAQVNVVLDDYFGTMGIAIRQGRAFDATDRSSEEEPGAGTVVISEGMARTLFPQENAVGRRLVVDFGKPFIAEIVGVAGDVRAFGQAEAAPDIMYFTQRQIAGAFNGRVMSLVVRTFGDPSSLTAPLRALVHELEPGMPLASVATMTDLLRDSVARSRLRAVLLAAFAGFALVLAVVGLYGVLSYVVTQRTPEMGVRIALGAGRADIFTRVLRRGMALVAFGLAIGMVAAVGASRVFARMLYGTGPVDAGVFAVVTLALAGAGVVACLVPAVRATRVDPLTVLRSS